MLPPPTAYPELTLNLLTFFYLTEKLMPDVNASYKCRRFANGANLQHLFSVFTTCF